jgi:ABC-type lipoprotein export system ATPase subunit/SAM-dependent methyltransferase
MRISKWLVESKITQTKGLQPIFLNKLGPVVALVGRNGSGKSRILDLLEKSQSWIKLFMFYDNSFSFYPKNKERLDTLENIDLRNCDLSEYVIFFQDFHKSIIDENHKKQVKEYIVSLEKPVSKKSLINRLFNKDEKKAEKTIEKIPMEYNRSSYNYSHTPYNTPKIPDPESFFDDKIKRINYSDIHYLQSALEKKRHQNDDVENDTPTEKKKGSADKKNRNFDFHKLLDKTPLKTGEHEIKIINESGRTFFETLKHELVRDFYLAIGVPEEYEKKDSFKQYYILKKFIKSFMNKDLTYKKVEVNDIADIDGVTTSSKGMWELNGNPFDYDSLSDGEKTLFTYSILFFVLELNSEIPIRNSIIIIDEPELHLHPGSEIAVINGIKNIIKDSGQLWIATHSLSILSSLDVNEIFLVKDGKINSPNRLTPGKTLIELMDATETLENLNNFVSNQSIWAYVSFIEQCFSEPDVFFSAELGDPQIEVFMKAIKNYPEGAMLLDFGAGKGRVYKQIKNELSLDLTYHALEPDNECRDILKEAGIKKVIANYEDLESKQYHFVCLCNVLHEIHINAWEMILNKIVSCLKDNGFLIIIEDLKIPKGERIDGAGFLVLDVESICSLLGLKNEPIVIKSEKFGMDSRIMCTVIQKKETSKVSVNQIINALRIRKKNVWDEMLKIKPFYDEQKTENEGVKFGREYAFLSQLYINCERGIEIFNQSK